MAPIVGASSLSRPTNTTYPSDALGGAVEPKRTLPDRCPGITVSELAITWVLTLLLEESNRR